MNNKGMDKQGKVLRLRSSEVRIIVDRCNKKEYIKMYNKQIRKKSNKN